MNVETGQVYDKQVLDEQKRLREAVLRGEPIVDVSEKVAREMRIAKSRIKTLKRRVPKKYQNRSKY